MPDQPAAENNLIDVHAHYLGGSVAEAFATRLSLAGGFRMSVDWTPDVALASMDRLGIGVAVLSAPWIFAGTASEPEAAKRYARAVNEEYAELIRAHPRRFGAFASVPGDSADAMISEIDYALDTLHLDGVMLTSNVEGRYPGDAWFEPVLAELNRRQAPTFIHPADSPAIRELGFGRPSSVCEFPFDTARALVNAVYRGVFQRYPRLRLILAHCGGALPTLAWRIAEHTRAVGPHDSPVTSAHVGTVLRGLFYDVALAGSRNSLLPTLEVTGHDHLLYGTDWPAAPEPLVVDNTGELLRSGLFTATQLADVQYGNAERLFPRLRREAAELSEQLTPDRH